jgi:hypothetical protein
MNQNADTKDVFRELDGFLVLYNVLSTVRDSPGDEDQTAKNLEGVRLILGNLSDATFEHGVNARFYKVCILVLCRANALFSMTSEWLVTSP